MLYKKILELIKKYTEEYFLDFEYLYYFTSTYIGDEVGIKRNTASHYLNKLNRESICIKTNTRPVYFFHRKTLESKYGKLDKFVFDSIEDLEVEILPVEDKKAKDPFETLIGHCGSLRNQVEQCKSAILYPPKGLPTLITGASGSGKSFMAEIMYEYAVKEGVVDEESPFIIFNCAQYANNPELISSNLFGYVKGAFTGADKDYDGVLESANGGFLFLDEAHRLNAEGQEKLFTFMDKGIYKRMGESDSWHSLNVRLIFATTENVEDIFLDTFIRRIPLTIGIPTLEERGEVEKRECIYRFFYEESKRMKKDILVSPHVIHLLLEHGFMGNLGELKNIIKNICALAFTRQRKKERININIDLLPPKIYKILISNEKIETLAGNDYILFEQNEEMPIIQKRVSIDNTIIPNMYKKIVLELNKYKNSEIEFRELNENIAETMNNCFDKIAFLRKENVNENELRMDYITTSITNVFNFFKENYGISFTGNDVLTLSYYLYYRSYVDFDNNIRKEVKDIVDTLITKEYMNEYKIAGRIMNVLDRSFDIPLTFEDKVIITFYLKNIETKYISNRIKCIILTHGYSTASSLANVGNRLYGENLFEAFDMPLNVSMYEIIEEIKSYMNNVDISNGLIVLVDMGSLLKLHNEILKFTGGIVAIMNNVSTQMVLDVGSMINRDLDINTIMEKASKNVNVNYEIILPEGNKKKVIITTCITGIGTAQKIKSLLLESFTKDVETEVIAYDFYKLRKSGIQDEIFDLYDVLAIIGTADPRIDNMKYISLEEIISSDGESNIFDIFDGILEEKVIKEINNNIVRIFSLERVIDSLTVLSGDKIMDHVEETIEAMEDMMNMNFMNDLKISLYIHVSCLLERLIRKRDISEYEGLEQFCIQNKKFVEIIKESFSVLEKAYDVKVTGSEIGYIHDIFELKINDFHL